jgi:hypothetical protein
MAPRNSKKRVKEEDDKEYCEVPVPVHGRQSKKRMTNSTSPLPSSRNVSASHPTPKESPNVVRKSEIINLDEEKPQEKLLTIVHKPMYPPTGCFPRFEEGNVYIELKHRNGKFSYQLHSGVLRRNSEWFSHALLEPLPELDDEVARQITKRTNVKFRLELFKGPEFDLEVLLKTVGLFLSSYPLRFPRERVPDKSNIILST